MSLYAVGITMTFEAGALVAVEKVQRKTGRSREAWFDGVKIGREDIYEPVARIVGIELLTGEVPEMAAAVATRLRSEPMLDDVQARLDIGMLGRPGLRVFSNHGAHPVPVVVGGEKEAADKSGTVTLPVSTLQSVAALMFQQHRVEVVDSLIDGPTLQHALRNLDKLPEVGPARDLGIAAGLAVWTAYTTASTDAWVSSKPSPTACEDEWTKRAKSSAIRHAARAARRSAPWDD